MSKLDKRNPIAKAIKLALLATASAVTFSTPAFSAEEEDEAENNVEERVVITGSRIQRNEFSSSSPVSSFSSEDIQVKGLAIDEFLKNVSAFTGYQQGASTNNGSDGQRKIDMRGLGFNRTLVLINGRRQIGDVNGDGAVDLNSIPAAMVERIDVLKDGASTIYGTDAMAGVVNVILKSNFDGVEMTYDYGSSFESDAQNKGFSILGGVSGDRGNVTMSLEYHEQREMIQADRDWAQDTLYPLLQSDGSFLATPSGSSNSRRIRGVPGLPGNFIVDETTGEVRAFAPTDVYNFAPVNALITPNERWQVAANGNFELVDNGKLSSFFEALYTRRTSHQRLAPDATFGVTTTYRSLSTGLEQRNDLVPASNPFNPFGVNAAGTDGVCGTADDLNPFSVCNEAVRLNRRFEESGGRLFQQTADTFRLVTGLSGELTDTISWDLSYTYAQNEVIAETKNYHRFDRWEIAVTPSLCALNPDCTAAGVLNPFGAFGTISPEQMQFLSANSLKDLSFGELKMWQLGLSGDTSDSFEFDGGPLAWAVGYETRDEAGFFTPDEFSAEGLTTGGASDPQNGSFSVDEFYGEVFMPISDNFSLDFSARTSSYDTSAGDTSIFKLGIDWEIVDGIRLRSGFGTGFRAPNISELNQDQATGFPVMEPLCEFSDRRTDITETQRQNCSFLVGDLNGDPTLLGDAGEYGFAWQSAYTTAAPTTPLTPEESTNFTIGLVMDLGEDDGFVASVDYWKIEIEDFIGSPNLNDLFSACLNTADLSGSSCAVFSGNLPTADGVPGSLATQFLTQYPNATGNPIDFIFPAGGTSVFGNLGTVTTDGFEFELQYSEEVDWSGINKFDVRWSGSYVLSREEEYDLSGTRELVGTADGFGVYPELRMNTSATIYGNDWTFSWDTSFISETDDIRRPAELTDDAKAEAILYHDLVGTYNYDNYSFVVGINNVTDEDAPRFHSAFNANTEPGMYDVIGRRFFASVKVSF